jgi:hypothetical protein
MALHSLYFELLSERGLVGFGLFVAMATMHFRTSRRMRLMAARGAFGGHYLKLEAMHFSLALEASMAGFLAAGAFLSMATYPHFWFLTAQAVALERALRRQSVSRNDRARRLVASERAAPTQPLRSRPHGS